MPAVHNPNPNRASRPRPTLARADPPAPPMAVAVPLPARGAVALSAQPVAARPVQAPTPLAAAPAQTDVCPHLRARLPTYRALLRCTRACAHYLARSGVNRAARLPCCRQNAATPVVAALWRLRRAICSQLRDQFARFSRAAAMRARARPLPSKKRRKCCSLSEAAVRAAVYAELSYPCTCAIERLMV